MLCKGGVEKLNLQRNAKSSHTEVFCQKLLKFCKSHRKTSLKNIQSLFFNKVAGWKPETIGSSH